MKPDAFSIRRRLEKVLVDPARAGCASRLRSLCRLGAGRSVHLMTLLWRGSLAGGVQRRQVGRPMRSPRSFLSWSTRSGWAPACRDFVSKLCILVRASGTAWPDGLLRSSKLGADGRPFSALRSGP
jgi:hypothetical protein